MPPLVLLHSHAAGLGDASNSSDRNSYLPDLPAGGGRIFNGCTIIDVRSLTYI
ncbi:hypothetical protein [Microcoleus sp. herbarium12]|uniref:hypothetical protein n=1 Tax=Microcoleus sp. herbarium12 TaxID=3055437 RepID=UPI002FCF95F0